MFQPKLRSEKFDNDNDDYYDCDDNNNNNNNKPVLYEMHVVPSLWETEINSRETGQFTIFYILKFALLENRRVRKYSKPNYSILWILSYLHLLLHVFSIADGCDKYLNFVRILKELVTQIYI